MRIRNGTANSDGQTTRLGGKGLKRRQMIRLGPYVIMPLYVLRHPRLSLQAKAVFAELLSFLWKDKDTCYPSQERLAQDLGLSGRTIRRHIGELKAAGILGQHKQSRRKNANEYFFPEPPRDAVENPLLANNGSLTDRAIKCDERASASLRATGQGCPSGRTTGGQKCPRLTSLEDKNVLRSSTNIKKDKKASSTRADGVFISEQDGRDKAARYPKRSATLKKYLRAKGLYPVFRAEQEHVCDLDDDIVASYAEASSSMRNPPAFFRHQLRHRDHTFHEYHESPLKVIRSARVYKRREREERNLLRTLKRKLDASEIWDAVATEYAHAAAVYDCDKKDKVSREAVDMERRRFYQTYVPGGYDRKGRLVIVRPDMYFPMKDRDRKTLRLALRRVHVKRYRLEVLSAPDFSDRKRLSVMRSLGFPLALVRKPVFCQGGPTSDAAPLMSKAV